jgi:uncharacterized protein YjbI with pentapeptide repeats
MTDPAGTEVARETLMHTKMQSSEDTDADDEPDDRDRLRRILDGAAYTAACAEISGWTSELLKQSGRGIDLSTADISNMSLKGLDLRGAMLSRSMMYGTHLDRADLSGASLSCPAMEKTSFRGAILRGMYFHASAAQVCDFTGADLSNVLDGTGTLFHGCRFVDASFNYSALAGATFYQCDLRGTTWQSAVLQGATFNECILDGASFSRANLEHVTISRCHLDSVSFEGAVGRGLSIHRPTAASALRFDGAQLPGMRISGVRGDKWSANAAHFVDIDLTECALVDAVFTNADLTGGRVVRCELAGIDLSEATLLGCTFAYTSAVGAKLRAANAENFVIHECSLQQASLEGIKARGIIVRDSDMSRAKMAGAYLYRATITGDPPRSMSLRGADLQGATIVQANIAADLSEACLVGVHASYVRLNQSILASSDLRGIALFDASLVKTDFTGAEISILRPPFFADRCPGLDRALAEANDQAGLRFVEHFSEVLGSGTRSSTLA